MNRSIFATTVAEIQAEQENLYNTAPKAEHTISETVLLIFFGTAVLSMIATFLAKEFHKNKKELAVKEKTTQVPCPNCQYFSKSSYLRCAVQPKLTMTDEAVNCSDFIKQENRKSLV